MRLSYESLFSCCRADWLKIELFHLTDNYGGRWVTIFLRLVGRILL